MWRRREEIADAQPEAGEHRAAVQLVIGAKNTDLRGRFIDIDSLVARMDHPDKLHARGPVGLEGLTSEKYVVYGDGHVRG